MNGLALISILMGVLIIISRGPLIFAPEIMRKFYMKLIATSTRIRIMGLCITPLGAVAIMVARGSDQTASLIISVIGYIMVLIAVFFMLIFPSLSKQVADAFLEAMDNLMLRILGLLAVCLGALFIYLGLAVFR